MTWFKLGLEIFLNNSKSIFFSFKTRVDRDEVYNLIISQPGIFFLQQVSIYSFFICLGLKRLEETNLKLVLTKWQNGEISNFDYLMYLNHEAGGFMYN